MVVAPTLIYTVSLLASQILGAVVAALTVFLIISKTLTRHWERYAKHRQRKIKDWVHAYVEQESPMARMELEVLGFFDRIILRSLLLEISEHAAGLRERRIEELYDRTGLAGEDLRILRRSWLWWNRAAAAHRLGQIKVKRAKAHLIYALRDPHTEVRLEATWALGHMKWVDVLPHIMKSMAHYFKIAALRMDDFIYEMGTPALPMLHDLCREAEPEIQLLAIHLIGEFKNSQSLEIILPLLTSPLLEIRLAACKAVGTLGDPAGLHALLPCTKDDAWQMRAQAAKQFGRCRFYLAIPELVRSLEDQQWWVRYNSGEALAGMGGRGKLALYRALQSKDRFARDMAAQWIDEMEAASA